MNRAETTKFLGELLERQYLRGLGKHWAKEVSIDPGSSTEYGIIVAIPKTRMLEDEFQNPTPLDGNLDKWKLAIAIKCFDGRRKRSMVELLFCMLRSGR